MMMMRMRQLKWEANVNKKQNSKNLKRKTNLNKQHLRKQEMLLNKKTKMKQTPFL